MKCRHLATTDAFAGNGQADDWKPIPMFLCCWPVDRLAGAPEWVNRRIGGGNPVEPKVECPTCPAFEKQTHEAN